MRGLNGSDIQGMKAASVAHLGYKWELYIYLRTDMKYHHHQFREMHMRKGQATAGVTLLHGTKRDMWR